MLALINIAVVSEYAVIERVGENKFCSVLVQRFIARAFNTLFKKKVRNILEAIITLGVELKSGTDDFRFSSVNDNRFSPHIV